MPISDLFHLGTTDEAGAFYDSGSIAHGRTGEGGFAVVVVRGSSRHLDRGVHHGQKCCLEAHVEVLAPAASIANGLSKRFLRNAGLTRSVSSSTSCFSS